MKPRRIVTSLAVAGAFLGVMGSARAAPPTKPECSESHAKSQELRLDTKLIEARSELRVCSDAACPGALQTDCAGWLAEVQQSIPSVEFLIDLGAEERQKLEIFIDGQALTAGFDKPHELNPGAHAFRFVLEGYPAQEQTIVVRQNEKRTVLRVEFKKEAPPPPLAGSEPPKTAPVSPAQPPAALETSRPVPAVTYVFGGLALVAAGASAYLGLNAVSKHDDKQASCAPNCPDGDVDDLKTELLLADVSAGVAVISAGIALYSYLSRPVVTAERPPTGAGRLRILVAPNTVGLRVSGAF
jgi:hypothetical protein